MLTTLSRSVLQTGKQRSRSFFGVSKIFCSVAAINTMSFKYPKPRRDDSIVENLHGVMVKDPYRYLEDPDSEETANFVHEQNKVTKAFIDQCDVKEKIMEKLKLLLDYPRIGCPSKHGSNYFFRKNDGLQNQSVLYIQDSLKSEPKVFLDPNQLDKDGLVALDFTSFSEDGEWCAYALADSGSDWRRIKCRNVKTGVDTDETLLYCKFTHASWTHDNKGFFYSRYPKTDKFDGTETDECGSQVVYYHRVGTPQDEDIFVLDFAGNESVTIATEVSDCGKYLFVSTHKSCKNNTFYYAHLDGDINGKIDVKPIITEFEADYNFIANDGPLVYLLTDRKAPNKKVIAINLNEPEEKNWIDIVPEHEKNVLNCALCVDGDKLFTNYEVDVVHVIEFRQLKDGKLIYKPKIPIGSVVQLSGKKTQSQIFFQMQSFVSPGITYTYDFKSDSEISIFRETPVKGFDPSQIVTKQVFYPSKDGTLIPMFIYHSKDFKQDGETPCSLYGYGGFTVSLSPAYSPTRLVMLQNFKGIHAVANLRGGSEYGEKWHQAGCLDNKQNVFDDFIAAAEYLIKNKYTNNKKLVIEGGSNGGLLVAACSNQRPDLFGATICIVGVLDCLRFHKFTIGKYWISDFGDPDKEKDFKVLFKYSPLHNIPVGTDVYPKFLICTGDHDDRVAPLHSLKFAAELQYSLNLPGTPLLARIEVNSGHGATKPINKTIEERADIYSFIKLALDIPYHE